MTWEVLEVDVDWVPFPEQYAAVMASVGKNMDEGPLRYWVTNQHGSVIDLDYGGDGIRYHRRLDADIRCTGREAYISFDPQHPQCGVCRRFIPRKRNYFERQRWVCWSCDD